MIKEFKTAISNTTSSSKGSGSGNMILWGLLLAGVVYFGYKYIEKRNRVVVTKEQD